MDNFADFMLYTVSDRCDYKAVEPVSLRINTSQRTDPIKVSDLINRLAFLANLC